MEDAFEGGIDWLGPILRFPSSLVRSSHVLALIDTKQQPVEMGDEYEQQPQENRAKPKEITSEQRRDNLIGVGMWSFMIAVVWKYVIKTPPQRQPGFDWGYDDDFKFDLLGIKPGYRGEGCATICICSCCCPCIRWAETLSYVRPFFSFWLFWAVYCFLYLSRTYFDGERMMIPMLIAWSLLAAICAYFRQELRFAYNLKLGPQEFQEGSGPHWASRFLDCFTYCFLPCCTIAQEARQVELSMRCGHEAVAPWPVAMPENGSRV
jgi:Cys-rich protein (TIGR01571 family)